MAALQALRHYFIFGVLWVGYAVFETGANYLIVHRWKGGPMGSGEASAARNTLFGALALAAFFAPCGGRRGKQQCCAVVGKAGSSSSGSCSGAVVVAPPHRCALGKAVLRARPTRAQWRAFAADSAALFAAGIANRTQSLLFSAYAARLGTDGAGAMVIAKRVLEYPTQVSAAMVVVSAVFSSGTFRAKQQQQQQQQQQQKKQQEQEQCRDAAAAAAAAAAATTAARATMGLLGCLTVAIASVFALGSSQLYSLFSPDATLVATLQRQDSLMCALSLCTVAQGVASGLAYGAQRFREISAVTCAALLLAFLPVLLYGLHWRKGGITLGLLLAGNLAYTAVTLIGNAIVVVTMGARAADAAVDGHGGGGDTHSAAGGFAKASEEPLLPT